MNENCDNLYSGLNDLKSLLAAFGTEYAECQTKKDFSPLKEKKDKIKEILADLKIEVPSEGRFLRRVDSMKFHKDQKKNQKMKEKLKSLLDVQLYDEAMETLKSFWPGVDLASSFSVPPHHEIVRLLGNLKPEQLKGLAEMKKPVLLIIPPVNRYGLIDRVNRYKKFRGQTDIKIDGDAHNVAWPDWSDEKLKMEVVVVDGEPLMPPHREVKPIQNNLKRIKKYRELYAARGMKMITADQYLLLQMHSLWQYERDVKPESAGGKGLSHTEALNKFVDNGDAGPDSSMTILNADHLSPTDPRVPIGSFDSRYIYIYTGSHDFPVDDLVARPALRLL